MITRVCRDDFERAFKGSQYENNFSGLGLMVLFDYLELREEQEGDDFIFETWSVTEDFKEYESFTDFFAQHGEYTKYQNIDELADKYNVLKIKDWQDNGEGFIIELFNE